MATNPGTGPDESERTEPGNAGGSNPAGGTVPRSDVDESASERDETGFDDAELPENGESGSERIEDEPLPEDEESAALDDAQEQAAEERKEGGYQ